MSGKLKSEVMSRGTAVALGTGAMVATSLAHADGTFDTSAITAAGATIALVGTAVFAVKVGIKVYNWVSRALS